MRRILTSLLLTIFLCSITFAQETQDAKTQRLLDQAAKGGNGLQTEINVNGNVHVQAVLIPRVDARRIFGKEIADNYAVIEVNVGNKSKDASLIIHGIFIDYREWPFSGSTRDDLNAPGSTDNYQASAFPNQVASEEYRAVRGQMLDAQNDTLRNRFLRWLTLAGNLAGAFTFSINEQGIVKGIGAATGVGIPGVATAWPDKTIDQLNRVSDFGFRTNKVIPREGSDIIVCFFPIDRFLTPGFRKLFLKSPALFFAPGQMLADKSAEKDVKEVVEGLGFDFAKLREDLPCFINIKHARADHNDPAYDACLDSFDLERLKDAKPGERAYKFKENALTDKFKHFMALEFINSVSLNRVTITVDGVMAIDVNAVAARIDAVEFDKVAGCGDATQECFWKSLTTVNGVRTGVIHGAYLKGSDVAIAEADDLQIKELKKVDETSTDDELHFSFKLGAPINNQEKLTFLVTKPPASEGGKKLESNTWVYPVSRPVSAPKLSSLAPTVGADPNDANKNILTIKGKGFANGATVELLPEFGDAVKVSGDSVIVVDTTQIRVKLPRLHAGCWRAEVESAGLPSDKSPKFRIEPNPSLEAAERDDNFIFVAGTDLVNFANCGGDQIKFKLIPSNGSKPVDLTVDSWGDGEPRLVLPAKAKNSQAGDWKVQVSLGSSDKNSVDLKVRGQ